MSVQPLAEAKRANRFEVVCEVDEAIRRNDVEAMKKLVAVCEQLGNAQKLIDRMTNFQTGKDVRHEMLAL